jgi:hypothetical protein
MRSMDDRAEIRGLFLRFPLEDCIGMMAPAIWSSGLLDASSPSGSMELVPPETLALWDSVSHFTVYLFLFGLRRRGPVSLFWYLF